MTSAQRDSAVAQALAEREGPRVRVSAEFANVSYGSRRVRAHVSLDDDAYVLVGQITPDGIVRIVFPEEPTDDGFLRGRHSYQTAEFFAGFDDQYRYRIASSPYGRFGPATRDSYDAGFGFLFVVASWRPMRFDRFSSGGVWDSYELVDHDYVRDPRPAVYELAALLAGTNPEAYTVEFAHYSTTRYAYDGGGGSGMSTYGYGYCNGFAPFGFASGPFGDYSLFKLSLPYGQSFYYRGTYYRYNAFGDCYTAGLPVFGFGGYYYNPGGYFNAPQAPPLYPRRPFNLNARNPIEPQSPRARIALDAAKANDASSEGAKVSPVYRSRGLLTSDTPDSRRGSGAEPAPRTRPTIQDMVGKHFEGREGFTRAQLAGDNGNTQPTRNQPRFDTPTRGREIGNAGNGGNGGNGDNRGGFTRGNPGDSPRVTPRDESPRIQNPRSDGPRSDAPRFTPPPQRSEAPRSEPPRFSNPAPRSEAPTRSEAPRVERSSPPPAPAPRTEAPPARPPETKPPGR
jgi:hypothetical protein